MPVYCLDNFKHPYIRFEKRFLWPSVHLIRTVDEETEKVRALLSEYWPDFSEEYAFWRNERFSGHQRYLSFVCQSDALKQYGMMLELRVLAGYAGGAEPEEIVRPAEQDRSPEFYTDRIYFKAALVPVEEYRVGRGQVQHIDIRTFNEILQASSYSLSVDQKEVWTTALFDSIDYTAIQERILQLLGELEAWKPGRLFFPVVIEHMTFCLNVLTLQQAEAMAAAFAELIKHIQQEDLRGMQSVEQWKRYIAGWKMDRTLSRSGNPHWIFAQIPEAV